MDIYFILWVLIPYYFIYVLAQISSVLVRGVPVSLWHTSILFFLFFFLSTYLLSSTTRCPKLIFYFPHWSTRISYVSKLPPQCLVPFIGECCQKPSDRYAHCFWVSFLSPLSWLSSKHTKCIRPTISVSVYHYLYEALYRLFDVSSSISLPHG